MWKTIYVYYFDNKNELIANVLIPTLEKLKKQYNDEFSYFLCRHWKLGPHIAVNLYFENIEDLGEKVFTQVKDQIEKYFSQYPSKKNIDKDRYIQMSKQLGAFELDKGPYEPLQEDNSIMLGSYFFENKFSFLKREQKQYVENLYIEMAPIIGNILSLNFDSKEDKIRFDVNLFLAVAGIHPRGMEKGIESYKSHVEAFLSIEEYRENILNRYNNDMIKFLNNSKHLEGRSYFALDNYQQKIINDFEELFKKYYKEFYCFGNEIIFPEADFVENIVATAKENNVDGISDRRSNISSYHKQLFEDSRYFDLVRSPEFKAYRLSVNAFYNMLPVIGINAWDKQFVCYLISELIRDNKEEVDYASNN